MADSYTHPQPITLRDETNGDTFVLEYTRNTCVFINNAGFNFNKITDNPEEMIPLLFYGAFRKNHKRITKEQSDKMLERMGGLTKKFFDRLVELYLSGRESLVIDDDEYDAKNAGLTVEL